MYTKTFLIMLILILIYKKKNYSELFIDNTKKVCSDINGGCYNVQTRFNPKTYKNAADTLDIINKTNMVLFEHLSNKYIDSPYSPNLNITPEIFDDRKNKIEHLIRKYNPNSIVEHAPASKHNTSYVFGKGQRIGYCLREHRSGNYNIHPIETLYFVNLHELSHLLDSKFNPGHNVSFWKDFKFLLQEAVEAGTYSPIDYSIHPISYCGIKIFYNPLMDHTI